jgi:hypothetical protein
VQRGPAAAACVLGACLFHGPLTKSQHDLWDWLNLLLDPVAVGIAAPSWVTTRYGSLQVDKQTRHTWAMFWIALLVVFLMAWLSVDLILVAK